MNPRSFKLDWARLVEWQTFSEKEIEIQPEKGREPPGWRQYTDSTTEICGSPTKVHGYGTPNDCYKWHTIGDQVTASFEYIPALSNVFLKYYRFLNSEIYF